MYYVQAVVEDILQEAVLRKLLSTYRSDITLSGVLGYKGNTYIKEKLRAFNEASQYLPHIVITDLDTNICAPSLIEAWIEFDKHPNLLFRIAVREIEAWVMADREAFASFMGIHTSNIPQNSEYINDPKSLIISLARKTRKRKMKDLLPIGTGYQGPGYNTLMAEFITQEWNPDIAKNHNNSLSKTIERLSNFLR